jgi:hypothetical protein
MGGCVVTKPKMLGAAALAAVAVAAGTLVAVPSASAMRPLECSAAMNVADSYRAIGDAAAAAGYWWLQQYWYGKAAGILNGACYWEP